MKIISLGTTEFIKYCINVLSMVVNKWFYLCLCPKNFNPITPLI
jgi:hypothetical protein